MDVTIDTGSKTAVNMAIYLFMFLLIAMAVVTAFLVQVPYLQCVAKRNETGEVDERCQKIINAHENR